MTHATSSNQNSIGTKSTTTAADQLADFVIDGYRSIALAGRGSHAEVWKVQEQASGRHYALKRLRPDKEMRPVALRLLENETQVVRSCPGNYVVKFVNARLDSPQAYLILEWLNGETLDQRLHREGRLSIRHSLWIARQCSLALNNLQQAGYTHGDIKPANIFLNRKGEVKLIDLGFARSLQDRQTTLPSALLIGTAEYMAPETLSREASSPISRDMYSLGVILYQMLTGRQPFEASSTADVLRLQRQTKSPLLHLQRPDTPPGLVELVRKLLAKHPIRRPASYQCLVRELISLELASMTNISSRLRTLLA